MKKTILLIISILVLAFSSNYLWDKCPAAWIGLVCLGFLVLITRRREVWVKGTEKPMSILERQTRDTTAPAGMEEAIRERVKLNAEAKAENPPPYRMREIAKRLIFIDGYLAGYDQNNKEE